MIFVVICDFSIFTLDLGGYKHDNDTFFSLKVLLFKTIANVI